MKNSSLIITVIFGFKLLMTFWLLKLANCSSQSLGWSFALYGGDTSSYFIPFDNLIEHGKYYIQYSHDIAYAGRLPVYGSLYGLLRVIKVPLDYIYITYVVLQVLFEAIAIFYTGKIALKITKYKWSFYLAIVLMSLSSYQTYYSLYLQPESIGISILIFITYLFFFKEHTNKNLFINSILIFILTAIKPYFGILIPVFIFLIYFKNKSSIPYIKLFILPFFTILFISTWTIRNYSITNEIIPLTEKYSGYFYPQSTIDFRKYMAVQGESAEYWDYDALSSYFYYPEKSKYSSQKVNILISPKKTEKIRSHFKNILNQQLNLEEEEEVINILNEEIIKYKNNSSFSLLIFNKIKLVKKFIFHSGSFYLPIVRNSICNNSFDWTFKLFQSLLYYVITISGLFGLLIVKKSPIIYYLLFIVTFLIVFFCFIIEFIELRYFYYSFPSLVIGTTIFISFVLQKFLPEKK